jgi:hypothetical protein
MVMDRYFIVSGTKRMSLTKWAEGKGIPPRTAQCRWQKMFPGLTEITPEQSLYLAIYIRKKRF